MKSVTDVFAECRIRKTPALLPFITSGYPDRRLFIDLVQEFMAGSADMIEIGIPFSDPMADGKTIQFSSQIALGNGVNIEKTFEYLSNMHGNGHVPFIIMSYFNPIHSYGIKRFIADAAQSSVRGLIIPDLIPEEGDQIESLCKKGGIDLIYLLAPTSGPARRNMILKRSQGFVYLVSIAGVTGARQSLPNNLVQWIDRVKEESRLPACVGFGISTVQQARLISRHADGIIVGSALIEVIKNSKTPARAINAAGKFIRQLRKGIDNV
jgi:tryptophan synthase alpha chain